MAVIGCSIYTRACFIDQWKWKVYPIFVTLYDEVTLSRTISKRTLKLKWELNFLSFKILFVCLYWRIAFFICVILTSLFITCRLYRDRQKPANGTQCPTLRQIVTTISHPPYAEREVFITRFYITKVYSCDGTSTLVLHNFDHFCVIIYIKDSRLFLKEQGHLPVFCLSLCK